MKLTTGDLINACAKERGLNLHKLATMSGVSYNTLYSIVRRKSDRVDRQIIEKIAKAMDILPNELMPFDDNEFYNSKMRTADESFVLEIGSQPTDNELVEATIRINLSAVDINLLSELYAFMRSRGFPENALLKIKTTLEAAKLEQSLLQCDPKMDTEV